MLNAITTSVKKRLTIIIKQSLDRSNGGPFRRLLITSIALTQLCDAVLLDKRLFDRVISRAQQTRGTFSVASMRTFLTKERQCRLEVEDRIKTYVGEST